MADRVSILGIPFDNMTMKEAVETVYAMRLEEKNHRIVTPNAEMAYLAQSEDRLAEILRTSDFMGSVLFMRQSCCKRRLSKK